MNTEYPGKENLPFTLGRRPAKPRKIRLNFSESWQSDSLKNFDPRQDLADEEVFSLCNKLSSASIRCDDDIRKKYCFESIKTFEDKNIDASLPSSKNNEDDSQAAPQFTPRQSPLSGRITPRKPLRPLKSASRSDPTFKGVIFKVRSGMKRSVSMEEFTPDTLIDSVYSARKRPRSQPSSDTKISIRRSGRRRACKTPVRLFSLSSSPWSSQADQFGSEDSGDSLLSSSPSCEEDFGMIPIHVEKECASCGTSKTPLWRDAEDGTHLCNACGIRWKKYRIRCIRCWYIPRKEEKMMRQCPSCNGTGTVRMTLPKSTKKHM